MSAELHTHPLVTQRLSQDTYKAIEKEVSRVGVPKDGIEAAYLLGIQHVLNVLRIKYVVGL